MPTPAAQTPSAQTPPPTSGDTGEEYVDSGDVLPQKQRSESTHPDPEPGEKSDAAQHEEAEGEAEKAKPKQKIKLKRGDAEQEYDEDAIREALDIADKRREHVRAANKRFEDAAAFHKTKIAPVEALLERIKTDPSAAFELIQQAGGSPEEVVAKFAQEYLERDKLTPEQRAVKAREAELAKKAADLQQQQEKIDNENHQREVAKYRETFKAEVTKVLPKFGLPDDPITVGEIAKTVAGQIRAGMEPDYEAAAEMEAERTDDLVAQHLDRLSRTPGAFVKKYPELAEKLRKEAVAAAITPPRVTRPSGKPATLPATDSKPKVKSWAEEEAELRRSRFGLKP